MISKEDKNILIEASERIKALFGSKIPEKMEVTVYLSNIEKKFADSINQLIDFITEISGFITPLSLGKLNTKTPQTKNVLASPFKELHSRLMHLTWQAQQIAKGDYSQRVDFMGDFSQAFNAMIISLDQKDKEIKDKIFQLEAKNNQILSEIHERKQMEKKQEQLIADLQHALGEVKILHGLLPICASCKKIRDDKGYWNQIESYIQKHSKAQFSHSMCPECSDKLYGKENWYIKMKKKKEIR